MTMNSHATYGLNFSRWKRKSLRLCFPDRRVEFVSSVSQVPDGAELSLWGVRTEREIEGRNVKVFRIEDGFLRSAGLGADLIQPLSWVIDTRGIYFDATRPSDLEVLLSETEFSDELLQRAAALRSIIIKEGLTKYNVGSAAWKRPATAGRVILVPGQVESDASIRYGAPDVNTNLGLLKLVRTANPDAYIMYKPHPDLLAGLRRAGTGEEHTANWCHEIVRDVSMESLLHEIDEVHCMTSLAGFEALVRGKKVICYGQPFYAGWGLTTDKIPVSRRKRCLSINELIAGALILYPRYFSLKKNRLTTPEEAIAELIAWKAKTGGKTSFWRQALRLILRSVVGVR